MQADPRQVAAGPGETNDEATRDGVTVGVENDGDGRGRLLCGDDRRVTALGHDHVYLAVDEFGGQGRKAIEVALRPAIFDRDVLTLDVSAFAQSLAECSNHSLRTSVVRRCGGEDADHRHRLLRTGCQRPRRCTPEYRNKIASSHRRTPKCALAGI